MSWRRQNVRRKLGAADDPPLRILILNWRDIRHPRSGGAEFFTHEVARRLVRDGDQVEWFSAAYPGAGSEETIDGVRVLRRGRQWTVHAHAARHYRGHLCGQFDVVVDEVNTIPFFAPVWADIPVCMLIHQLAREVWWYESPFPLNALGYAVEPLYLRPYRKIPVLTVSASTSKDLRRLGFVGRIITIPEGIEPVGQLAERKSTVPTFLYVGRLSPSKRVEVIIRAFAGFRKQSGAAQLWIVGEGPSRQELERLTNRLGVQGEVCFLGHLSREEKHWRMSSAHAVLMASAREGWGLVVSEANACGTPAIVYDVPGLRDSVRDGETGLVVEPRPDALQAAMVRLLQDNDLYDRLVAEAKRWSSSFDFDATTAIVRSMLLDEVRV
jgi:glycosyltransferase involved in cell wall biosynthesis